MKKKCKDSKHSLSMASFFFRNTTERDEKSWEWLKKEKLKKETEGNSCSGPGTENE